MANQLLAAGAKVRAIVRDAGKARSWADRGCELAIAEVNDSNALTEAFRGAEGVFVMLPPIFDPSPGFPEAQLAISALHSALDAAKPGRVAVLSTIGAQVGEPNLLTQLHMLEESPGTLQFSAAFIRAAWFMENSSWDIAPARDKGVVPSFLQPLDRTYPMIATEDVGEAVAKLLLGGWQGKRVVEIEGARRISPNEIAAELAKLLKRDVRMEALPRDAWEQSFHQMGMKNATPRLQMLDGFNAGWIEFESGAEGSVKMHTPIADVLRALIEKQ